MYRIAICDDEELTCFELESYLINISQKLQILIEIDIFYTGHQLCDFLSDKNSYDLIFLDIELGDFDGIETGDFIRNQLVDKNTLIIYISSKEQYAMKLFKIGTFDFLIKPLTIKTVQQVFLRVINQLNKVNSVFIYSIGKSSYRVKLNDILYFHSNLRKISIVTPTEKKDFYGRLSDISRSLQNFLFIQIHKSYLVNLNHVIRHTYEELELDNNTLLNISKTYRKKVREQLGEVGRYYD
jgi:DNA-binding LytR/AlgR family response regulator